MDSMTLTLPMSLSSELREKIRETGLSANELARQSGVPQPTITRFLNGQDIMLTTVEKLADSLGMSWRHEEESAPLKKPPKRRQAPS
jgi:plasmid maintenance system antidote protein VapI